MTLNQFMLDHYEDAFHQGTCDYPTHRGQAAEATCGDDIQVELQVKNERIAEAWFDGEGCQFALAAASVLMEHIEGQSIESVEQISVAEAIRLCGADLNERESACCVLALEAVRNALQSPIDELEPGGPTLAGPHLGDEC